MPSSEKKLYELEDLLHKSLGDVAAENLRINGDDSGNASKDFFKVGIPSALYQLLLSYDKRAVDLAVLVYITHNLDNVKKFKAELDEIHDKIPKDL
jgi:hypothetical protein